MDPTNTEESDKQEQLAREEVNTPLPQVNEDCPIAQNPKNNSEAVNKRNARQLRKECKTLYQGLITEYRRLNKKLKVNTNQKKEVRKVLPKLHKNDNIEELQEILATIKNTISQ